MNHDLSFRMMQGKGDKSGHIRKEGQQVLLSFRHLSPSLPCTLYRDGRVIDTQPASSQGSLQFTCQQDGFFFLCHEHTLLLWEAGEDSNQNYFRAQRLMPRPKKVPTKEIDDKDTLPRIQTKPKEAETAAISQPTPKPSEEEVTSPNPVSYTLKPPSDETQPKSLHPILNPRSSAPSVMTLPPLQWPPSVAHLQSIFHSGIPFRPFSAPGFRCIRLPSPNPALPYSVLGYQAKNSRVCALLQAVPGHPLIPPRGFEDARYQDGHFIRIHPLIQDKRQQ